MNEVRVSRSPQPIAVAERTGNGAATVRRRRRAAGKSRLVPVKLSRLRKPEALSLEAWQIALRRQFAAEQKLRMKNLGTEPLFSEFEITNPQTRRSYRVAIRGMALGSNYCSCPDFAVNTLGTCKHIEYVLARLMRRPGAKAALAAGFRPEFSEVYLRYGAQREVIFSPGAACPARLRSLAHRYFDAEGRLKDGAFARFHVFLKQAGGNGHELRCYDDALAFIARVRDRAALAERVGRAFPRGGRSAAFGRLLNVRLYPYQREGALFAARAGRCLIADDMGLGKTIQAIAAVEILARTAGLERVLVICPTSLKHQWKREIEKFSQRQATVVEGLLARRAELYAAPSFYKITNYDVVHRDRELLRRWQPELIVLDEAQRIKNWKTRTAQSVKSLDSPYAFVLTGTPLENRLEELYSIVEFVDRFRLGPMFRFLAEHQHVDQTGRVSGYRHLSKISETLQPILIRRTKDQVLPELPERMEKHIFVPMTPQQMDFHEENREIVGRIVQKWRRYGFLSEADQRRLMIALQNMRMSCNSTYLLDRKTDYGVKADELVQLLAEMLEDPERKVVIFSQWLRMHQIVVPRIERKRWGHVLFCGEVPGPARKGLIQRFREDPACRLFLSTDAGGVGLNLQHASAVINLDQPWNPAVLEQRIGRVHRLGQHRPVRVVHFVAQGTIEEGMLGLLGFKKAVFAGVLDGGQDEVFLGGTRLKRFMESVEKATGAIPAAMPLETSQAEAEREAAAAESPSGEPAQDAALALPRQQAWSDVLSTGTALVEKLGQALGLGAVAPASGPAPGASPATLVRDERSGRAYLQLPLPDPEALRRLIDTVADLVNGLRKTAGP